MPVAAEGKIRVAEEMDFRSILEIQRGVEGYMLEASAAVWCVLLQAQHETWNRSTSGDYLEIGVWKGKSASVLASFSRIYGNMLTVVDRKILPETRQTLDAISPRVNYVNSLSEELCQTEFYAKNRRRIAFAHIDGSHKFSAVISDLQICEQMLANFGIISVDDFHTDLFPQIPAAVYKYVFSGVSDLCIFLVGLNKAYLCRNLAKKHFMQFARTDLLPALERNGQKLTLAKTDRNDSFDAFGIGGFFERRLFGDELP
ncbi:MAG TPA: class I SAM-dependent methyltransferase [Rhizomicrobium sp.]|nr:class I SAM-dependent methyltransferase [Rhizomicrobium sp.]